MRHFVSIDNLQHYIERRTLINRTIPLVPNVSAAEQESLLENALLQFYVCYLLSPDKNVAVPKKYIA